MKRAVAIRSEPAAKRVDPKRAIDVEKQSLYARLRQFRRVDRIVGDKTVAIEPREPVISADPNVAVAGLRDGSDRAAGQIVIGGPAIDEVISGCGEKANR